MHKICSLWQESSHVIKITLLVRAVDINYVGERISHLYATHRGRGEYT